MENFDIIDALVVGANEVAVNGLSSEVIDQIYVTNPVEYEEYEAAETLPTDADDLEKLKSLLKEFNLVHLLPTLQCKGIIRFIIIL